jgi:hypothetical protein
MANCDPVYGEFEYNTGVVYGGHECFFVSPKIEVLARDLIRLDVDQDLVVDEEYLKESNYPIVGLTDPTKTLRVRKVQAPKDGSLAVPFVLMHIDRPEPGVVYKVTCDDAVNSRNGTHPHPAEAFGTFTLRPMKFDASRAITPTFLELRPGSNVRGILQGIMNEDDIIGGSKNERIIGT